MQDLVHDNRTFERVLVPGHAFHGRTFEQCTFTRCDLSKCDFTKSRFIDCAFVGCDLSMMKLRGAGLQNVVFKECRLLGVDFSACTEMLFSARFEHCVLDHSVFVRRRMSKTRFNKCSLKGVDFEQADLCEAVLENCDLQDAVFGSTQLRSADLTTAYNYRIDPEHNDLNGARLSVDGALGLLAKYGIVIE